MKWHTLEGGMRRTLVRILVATVVATLVSYLAFGAAFIAIENGTIQPANYDERKVADVEALVAEKGTALLNASAASQIEDAIGDSALKYQVVDSDGRTLYGTYRPDNVDLDRQMLLSEINTAHTEGDHYVHTVPIFDEKSNLVGAVRCEYALQMRFERTEQVAWLVIIFFVLALVSPVLWLLVFSWRFSRRFAAEIRTPLALLREVAGKISQRDLDFTVDYDEDNELGDLCRAFDDMQKSLSYSLSREWELEQQRRAMVAALAHDLKTPLSVIRAYSEALLDDTPLDDEQRGYIDVIATNVTRSATLIQRIQDVSLLEQAAQPTLAPCDLRAFLEGQVESMRAQARQQGVNVSLVVALSADGCYLLDQEALTRILGNLASNSLAVMPEGGTLTVAAEREGENLALEVRDSGPGFTAQDLHHATEEFYRGDAARDTRGGHAGLGLFIVQTLAAQLGGSVTLANNAEGGACVRARLPAQPCEEKA